MTVADIDGLRKIRKWAVRRQPGGSLISNEKRPWRLGSCSARAGDSSRDTDSQGTMTGSRLE